MEAAQKSFISSTFWTERIGVSAALKTLEIMEKNKSWEIITNVGKKIRMIWSDIADDNNLSINISGLSSLSSFNFVSKNNLKYKTLLENGKKNAFPTHRSVDASKIEAILENEMNTKKNQSWSRLDRIEKIDKLCQYAVKYCQENNQQKNRLISRT